MTLGIGNGTTCIDEMRLTADELNARLQILVLIFTCKLPSHCP